MSLVLTVLVYLPDPSSNANSSPKNIDMRNWTAPGTELVVFIRQYSRGWMIDLGNKSANGKEPNPQVDYEFQMRITVMEPQMSTGRRLAVFRFRTLDGAPENIRGTFELRIDANSGAPVELNELDGKVGGNTHVEKVGTDEVLFSDARGFPTSWIISVSDLVSIPGEVKEQRRVSTDQKYQVVKSLRPGAATSTSQSTLEVEAVDSSLEGAVRVRILQTWVPGEGWWRSFTRYVNGHLDLEATLVERSNP